MRRFASCVKPRRELSLGSTSSINGRAFQSGTLSSHADWQQAAGTLATSTMYSNSSDLTGRDYAHGHARNSVVPYGQGSAPAGALDLSTITESQRDLSYDLASPDRRGLAMADWEPLSPRDRYLHARERELRLSDSLSSLPKSARLGPGPWHYESLVSTTRKSLTRSPCFSPRLSPIASAVNHREAVNPAPGQTLKGMLQAQPTLAMRTKMLPVYDRHALDLVGDRRPYPRRGTPPEHRG